MDPVVLAIVLLVAGLAGGLFAGWLFASRPVAEWRERFEARDREARELDEKFRAAIRDLAGASERASRADDLATALDRTRSEHAQVLERARADHAATLDALRAEQRELASELATLREKTANFDEQKRLLLQAQEELKKTFENAGAKVLEGAQEAFLRRAGARFEESEKANAERIRTLLEPVGARLKSYEEQVSALEAKRVDSFGQLTGLIQSMREGQEKVREEAQRLGNSLRNAPKARGRWGEQQLKNVLEQCGLAEHTDFVTEHSIDTDEGRLRPDAIVRIPGNKLLVIDAKVSLNAYQDAFHADGDAAREAFLDQHAASMRNHIQTLGAKSYQSQFEEAPDYVLMFVPGEHFIAAALEHDPGLWNFAFERRVLLASPTNLVAIARTVAQVWRQDGLAKEAREIGRMGGELYDRLATAAEHMKRVGAGLETAVNNYNKFVGSFERNVLSSGRRLRDKHIEIGKREIEDVPQIESMPRYGEGSVAEAAE
ncbi:DNA recombination protein RmuC [Novosphingobium album (ex Liu et al. 2023)]|uniref:DNA recombination protein RmuC homolog n=1 Tax=Novosphingobium album (ex Liu et al. 2023) TaxID=3031130 RepID=A0ABT5WSH8_9SPHN|nr:DNA recombination protein RmuC [Novosphingobium album (ex Liu et al. 2023)]MDE8651958.1 DNA recombination protein RmuC [Novosphingobium album (ex Liu et al. 2023)]